MSVIKINYSRTSLVGTPGDRQNAFAVSGFVLTNIVCIEEALKGTEIVFVLTGVSIIKPCSY